MSDNDNNLKLDFERINILYANTKTGYWGIFIAIFLIGFVIQEFSAPGIAVFWVLAMLVSYIPRIVLTIIFSMRLAKREINQTNIKPWERYFFLHSLLPLLGFSAVLFIPYSDNSLIGILFYAVIILLLVGGGILSYSTSRAILLLFLNMFMLPLIIKCFWMQTILFYCLGFALVTGYILLMKLTSDQHKMILENIALKIEKENQSLTDPLTKLWNRRYLSLHIEKLVPSAQRSGEPFAIIIFDIDNFKHYNDTYGHTAGDELIVAVSNCLLECSRDVDLLARYGGDEFLLVLPSTDTEQVKIIVERIHRLIKEKTNVTLSAGLAVYANKIGFDQLIKRADKALYSAKARGRDGYVVADS